MAVPAYLRNESKAEYVTLATRLAAWALKWCKDERLFSRRERWIVTGDIWDNAKRALMCVKMANARRDLANDMDFKTREEYLRMSLDHLVALETLLTIKYEMILQGFNATKQPPMPMPPPPPAPPPPIETTTAPAQAGAAPPKGVKDRPPKEKKKRRLTHDEIDRVFEIFFGMAIDLKALIKGVMRSDEERHANAQTPG